MWHYVALFLYKAKIEIHCVFDKFCFFIVALCGTMWHYSYIKQKLKYVVFLMNFVFFALWHYVALCGTMWHYSCIKQKLNYIVFLINFVFLHCGTTWHYVALFLYKAKT